MEDLVQVEVKKVAGPIDHGAAIFLGDEKKTFVIFVGLFEATAILKEIKSQKSPRPLTHDLIASIFAGLGVTVQKVVINDLQDDTFFARLFLIQENELGKSLVEIDARPSDSIALALQQGCPVFVSPLVWERAEDMTWALEQAAREQEEGGERDFGESDLGDEDADDEAE